MKYPDDEVVAIFRDIANRLDAQWTHGMEYPFERKTVEKWDIEIGSMITEEGDCELLTYEDAMRALEGGYQKKGAV